MQNFYSNEHMKLYELVDKSWGKVDGASVIIPELQRSFIWEPERVILLMDSIIRGWPFGTLLLWKLIGDTDLKRFPNRGFYRIIDRLEKFTDKDIDRANQTTPKSPSAEYLMVLDGQQRLQSLILAVGGQDKWGFKLKNSDWHKHLGKTDSDTSVHWSMGVLCLDLKKFIDEYNKCNKKLLDVDFTKTLFWGVLDSQNDVSKINSSPLPFVQDGENKGRYVKFSRIWNGIDANSSQKEKEFKEVLEKELFNAWEVNDELKPELTEPLAELLVTIRDIKNLSVQFLQISPYSSAWDPQKYNEAIVNVFTRLNSAGRALKQEEITMAWLKVGWKPEHTNKKTAIECLDELREALSPIWKAENEEEVRLISYIWGIIHRSGTLIDSKGLLDGNIMQPMAGNISEDWIPLLDSIRESASLIADRKLDEVFSSFNALIVALSAFYLSTRWKNMHQAKWISMAEREQENFDKQIELSFNSFFDRWILCSQWAGIWASHSGQSVQKFANDIAATWKHIDKDCDTTNKFISAFEDLCNVLLDQVSSDAENHIKTFWVGRSNVSQYRTILWLWHRLNQDRLDKSLIQMRMKKSGKGRAPSMKMEVDHAVSDSYWRDLVESEVGEKTKNGIPLSTGTSEHAPEGFATKDEALNYINKLGNCSLLQTNFNRSKNKWPLWSFIKEVYEFETGTYKRDDWENALGMSPVLTETINSDTGLAATCADIKKAIDDRTESIRSEVMGFIKNKGQERFGVANLTGS